MSDGMNVRVLGSDGWYDVEVNGRIVGQARRESRRLPGKRKAIVWRAVYGTDFRGDFLGTFHTRAEAVAAVAERAARSLATP